MRVTRRALLGAMAAWAAPLRERVSVVTDEVAGSEEGAFAFCREHGVRAIELRSVPGTKKGYWDLPAGEQAAFARRVKDEGLRVTFIDSALGAAPLPGPEPVRKPGPAEAGRFARLGEDLDRVLGLADRVGCPAARCFGFRRVAEPTGLLARIADVLAPLGERAGRAGVRMLLENEASCNVMTCRELAAFARLSALGINWDPGNAVRAERAYPDGYALLPKGRIGNVQVKGKGILPGGPDPVDWAAIFRALAADGYAGWVGLETHTAQRYADSPAALRELRRALGA